MIKEKTQITVLKDFDGLNPEPVEVISRIVQKSGYRDRKGRPQNVRYWVSYKGANRSVFNLNNHGNCISLDSWEL